MSLDNVVTDEFERNRNIMIYGKIEKNNLEICRIKVFSRFLSQRSPSPLAQSCRLEGRGGWRTGRGGGGGGCLAGREGKKMLSLSLS